MTLYADAMKTYALTLLLTSAPLFAGVSSSTGSAPQSDCEPGWTLGLDALALRPFQSEGNYREGNYDFGYRGSLGYQFNDCLFTKMSYFGFDGDVLDEEIPDDGPGGRFNGTLDVSALDWVVGQHFRPTDKLTLSPFVGLRWAEFKEDFSEFTVSTVDGLYDEEHDFSGYGLIVGTDGTRSLANNFSLYGVAKQSVVFGSSDFSSRVTIDDVEDDAFSYSEDSVVSITELGFGLQYDFGFGNGATANIRAGVEGQYWAGLSGGFESEESFSDSENVGLAGFLLGANFRF